MDLDLTTYLLFTICGSLLGIAALYWEAVCKKIKAGLPDWGYKLACDLAFNLAYGFASAILRYFFVAPLHFHPPVPNGMPIPFLPPVTLAREEAMTRMVYCVPGAVNILFTVQFTVNR